jgi:hypothetical protein
LVPSVYRDTIKVVRGLNAGVDESGIGNKDDVGASNSETAEIGEEQVVVNRQSFWVQSVGWYLY